MILLLIILIAAKNRVNFSNFISYERRARYSNVTKENRNLKEIGINSDLEN